MTVLILIEKLKELEQRKDAQECCNKIQGVRYLERHRECGSRELKALIDEIEYLADAELILQGQADRRMDGQPNYTAMGILKEHGFTVTRGEHDSFGWLTGIIHLKDFCLVYG